VVDAPKGELNVGLSAEEQARKYLDLDNLTALFRRLDEDFNGYERRVIQAYLQDRNNGNGCVLAMGLLDLLGIESVAARRKRY
jgi:hypothetical protein